MAQQQYEKVSKIEEISSNKQTEQVEAFDSSVKQGHFEDMLNQQQDSTKVNVPIQTQARTQVSLMDQVRDLNTKVDQAGKASADGLAGQAKNLIAQIEQVKGKLSTSNVELKGSVQTLLKNKLSHIDENLRIALDKAGVEYAPANPAAQNLTNPIDRFLGLLTNGQFQLQNLSSQLEHMATQGVQMNPAKMLAVQIKVSQVNQQLELFINLLNSAIQSTKTIMNVQV